MFGGIEKTYIGVQKGGKHSGVEDATGVSACLVGITLFTTIGGKWSWRKSSRKVSSLIETS